MKDMKLQGGRAVKHFSVLKTVRKLAPLRYLALKGLLISPALEVISFRSVMGRPM